MNMQISNSQEPCLLKKIALGKAMGDYFCELSGDGYMGWYNAFVELSQCKDENEMEEKFTVWEPFESSSLEELLETVEMAADSIYADFTYILETAKKGMLKEEGLIRYFGIAKTDMSRMLELGFAES